MILVSDLMLFIAATLTVVVLVLVIEVILGCAALGARGREAPEFEGTIAVLVPAHDEEVGIEATLENIRRNLRPCDRLLVIADNCTDRTEIVAGMAGAEVIVRNDPSRRGKGYALEWGLKHLASAPPDVVVVIDADCRIDEGSLTGLARKAEGAGCAIQSLYLMRAHAKAGASQQVAEFAWRVRNHLRPLGLRVLGLPCPLFGSGMAFPWRAIGSVNFGTSNLVEDLQIGLDFARSGRAPRFYPELVVSSTFPSSDEGVQSQRRRWEHGHLDLLARTALPVLIEGIRNGDVDRIALGLDLMVPPLSLLISLTLALLLATSVAAMLGMSATPFWLSAFGCLLICGAIVLAWARVGRSSLPARALTRIPAYFFAKLPIYFSLLCGRRLSVWIRSDRS